MCFFYSEGPDTNWFSYLYALYDMFYVQLGVCKKSLENISFFLVKMYIQFLRTS